MKAYCGIGGTAPLILNFCSRWKGMISFAHQSVYLKEVTCSSQQTGGGVGPVPGWMLSNTDIFLAAGRELGCLTCSLVTTLSLLSWLLIDCV